MIRGYRAWHKEHKVYYVVADLDLKLEVIEIIHTVTNRREVFRFAEVVLEQATGLEDRFETMIYEGDVLRYDHNTFYKVTYSESDTGFMIEDENTSNYLGANYGRDYVIVGNIHQNGDLVNE